MIRLLPISSVLYVYHHAANAELNSQHDFWQLGLYVGPSLTVPGATRAAAVLINIRVNIITTTAIKGVSDGGHVAIYPTMNSNIECLLDKQDLIPDDSLLTVPFSGEPIPASDIPLSTVPHVQQFEPEPAPAPVAAATPVVQTVPVSPPSVVAPASSDSSIIPTAVSLSTPAAEPSISADAHIDPFSIPDPVPTPTSNTSPASPTAPVAPSSSSPRAKKSRQVSVRFATQSVDTELERLRKVNRARR